MVGVKNRSFSFLQKTFIQDSVVIGEDLSLEEANKRDASEWPILGKVSLEYSRCLR